MNAAENGPRLGENNRYRRKPGRDILKRTTVAVIVLIASSFHAWAGLDEGKAAYEAKDYKTALIEFSKDQKNPDALAWIGLLYQEGKGVKQDQQQRLVRHGPPTDYLATTQTAWGLKKT
jgi:TPR repeat protein